MKLKTPKTPKVDKNLEQPPLSYISGGNAKGKAALEKISS